MKRHGVSKLSSLCLNQLDVLLLFKKESTTDSEDVRRRRNFGRAWAGYGCRKCFDFSCQMKNSSQQILSQLLNSSASSFATLSPLLSSNVSSYVVNDSSAFEARRAAILPEIFFALRDRARHSAQDLFNQKCLVIDLVIRNLYVFYVGKHPIYTSE